MHRVDITDNKAEKRVWHKRIKALHGIARDLHYAISTSSNFGIKQNTQQSGQNNYRENSIMK